MKYNKRPKISHKYYMLYRNENTKKTCKCYIDGLWLKTDQIVVQKLIYQDSDDGKNFCDIEMTRNRFIRGILTTTGILDCLSCLDIRYMLLFIRRR